MENQLKNDFEKIVQSSNFSKNEIDFKKNFLNNFIENGFPSRKLENWKFSDISQIIKKNIGELNFYNQDLTPNKIDTSVYVNGLEHNKIVFINGRVEKIEINSEDQNKIEIFDKFDESEKINIENSLVNLNCALANKHYNIVVKENCSPDKPLVIYNLTNEKLNYKNINLRIDYKLEKNSSLRLIDISNDISNKNFINVYNNFELKEDSILKNYKIDKRYNYNIKYSFNNIEQETNSLSELFLLSIGSKFNKNEINCNLKGKFSSAFINGIFTLKNTQHHEIRTCINHLVENTKSYQLIKSVLDDESKSVYQGKIYVNSKAQKTDGYQLSKAILLNESSEFNAKPELEIYADDVKCSHGSASGSLNEDSIFYLMSRGLSIKQARELLINGFLLDVVEKITDSEIKNLIKNLIGVKE